MSSRVCAEHVVMPVRGLGHQTCVWVGKHVCGGDSGPDQCASVVCLISLANMLRVVWGAQTRDTTFSSNLVDSVEVWHWSVLALHASPQSMRKDRFPAVSALLVPMLSCCSGKMPSRAHSKNLQLSCTLCRALVGFEELVLDP